MEEKKAKKKMLLPLIIILGVFAALLITGGILMSQYTLVDGVVCPVSSTTLDLRNRGLDHFHGLARCKSLQSVDLRGNDLTAEDYGFLMEALPGCDIRFDVTLDGQRVDNKITDLLLEDLPEDWENLKLLPGLRTLVISRCSSPKAVENLVDAMPGCSIRYSLGLGDKWLPHDITSAALDGRTVDAQALNAQLGWFYDLTELTVENAAFTGEEMRLLLQNYPRIHFLWEIRAGSLRIPCTVSELDFSQGSDVDLDELGSQLDLFENLQSVDLSGSAVSPEKRVAFRSAHPETNVFWTVTLNDVPYSCDTEILDLNGTNFTDTAELEAALPFFPKLTKVEMCDCGLDNETMDALNQRYEDIRFVWRVYFGNYNLRTDDKYFIAAAWDNKVYLKNEDIGVFKYLTDLEGMDCGHMLFDDLSFLYYMPHMKYLILAECPITDITPIGSLKELKYLEIFQTRVSDLSPLVNCTALEDLNCCYINARQSDAWNALSKMDWLERLWYCNCPLSAEQKRQLQNNMPNCIFFLYQGLEPSGGCWRYHENYYEMRDFFEMYYMPAGTNGVDEDGAQIIVDDYGEEFHLDHFDGDPRWWESGKYPGMYPHFYGVTC